MEAIQIASSGAVSEVSDRAAFFALEHEWNDLVREADDQPFYRHEFLRIWMDNFAGGDRGRVLLQREPAGRLSAVLPLVQRRTRLCGVPVRELSAAANAHSARFDMIAGDPAAAAKGFLEHLAGDRSWDVLRLTDVPAGGAAWHLFEQAKRVGLPVGAWPSLQSPYIPLPDSVESLRSTLDAKFKANLRRRWRKLEAKGSVQIERVVGGDLLEAYLEEGLALERGGWKGRNGTAIAQSRSTRGFYSELARSAACAGTLALSFLRLNGCAVAFHYALEYGGRYLLLKPAYDEAHAECSPGQLLMDKVLEGCIARGLREFDFLGPDMPWKRDWTEQRRPHAWLYVFRDTALGRWLRLAKFRWVPAAKEAFATWGI